MARRAAGTRRKAQPYHHGNLRREILDAAIDEIAERGAVALSMRELARRAGVSHAAPAHHFGDKAGLLTAIAIEGFALMAEAMRAAYDTGTFLDVGVTYVRFSVEHPAHFEVMYRPDLYHRDDPAVVEARDTAGRWLYGPAGDEHPDDDALEIGIAAWSFVHGFASLWTTGNLQHRLGDDPIAAVRKVAPALFTPPARPAASPDRRRSSRR
jgi:AcrR family transcriptional regulator